MRQDDTKPNDILDIPGYIDYRIELKKLERRGYNRKKPRGISESVEDLVGQGFQVTRIQSFDEETYLPIPGKVDIYVRLLHK